MLYFLSTYVDNATIITVPITKATIQIIASGLSIKELLMGIYYVIQRGFLRGIHRSWRDFAKTGYEVKSKDISMHNTCIEALLSLRPNNEELGMHIDKVYIGVMDRVKYGIVHLTGDTVTTYHGILEECLLGEHTHQKTCVYAIYQAMKIIPHDSIDVIVRYSEVARLFNSEKHNYNKFPGYSDILKFYNDNTEMRNIHVKNVEDSYLTLLSCVVAMGDSHTDLADNLINKL